MKKKFESLSPSHQQLSNLLEKYQSGRFADVEKLAVSMAQEFPNHNFSWKILGVVFLLRGKRYESLNACQTAVSLSPKDAEAHFNLGNTFSVLGKLTEAEASFKQAVLLKPGYTEAHFNLGIALKELGRLEASIEALNKALGIKPDFAEAYYHIGNSLKEKGNLDEAINAYNQALTIKPDYDDCFIAMETLLAQIYDKKDLFNEINSKFLTSGSIQVFENLQHNNILSIFYFLQGDYKKSKKILRNLKKNMYSSKTDEIKDRRNIGYYNFLEHLIRKKSAAVLQSKNKIYYVGDSHCLTIAHETVKLDKQPFTIIPIHTIGAKAYHFSKQDPNEYKAITKRNLDKIPKKSVVFISFGEVDCRIDEGLINASQKTKLPLEQLVEITVSGFVKWFVNVNFENKHKYTFFNVPAPVFRHRHTLSENQKLASVIQFFNYTLKKELQNYSLGLVDIYETTRADDGFSNNLYHCDEWHLDNSIIPQVYDQLKIKKL